MDFNFMSGWSVLAIVGFILLVLWAGVWKAIALWKAARRGAVGWFVVFCILNTAGILEIIYIFLVAKKTSGCCESLEKNNLDFFIKLL